MFQYRTWAQGGPPPCFLAPSVYKSLVSRGDLDFSLDSDELGELLTESERQIVERIKNDVMQHMDVILEHGYTGPINSTYTEEIIAAVKVSILNQRALMIKEFMKGMELYGLADIIRENPETLEGFFVKGQQQPVDSNYLFALMKPEYSAEGGSRRPKEESVMDFFQYFIFQLEDKSTMCGYKEALAWKNTGNCDMTLVKI